MESKDSRKVKESLQQEHQKVLCEIESGSFQDRAYGSILGAFIADSCGYFLEFETDIISENVMKQCM